MPGLQMSGAVGPEDGVKTLANSITVLYVTDTHLSLVSMNIVNNLLIH